MRKILQTLVPLLFMYLIAVAWSIEIHQDLHDNQLRQTIRDVYYVSPVMAWFFLGTVAGSLFWPINLGCRLADRILFAYIGWVVLVSIAGVTNAVPNNPFGEFDRSVKNLTTPVPAVFAPLGAALGRLLFGAVIRRVADVQHDRQD